MDSWILYSPLSGSSELPALADSQLQPCFISNTFFVWDSMMKVLLVYPEYPVTFWSFDYALKFISKKAAYPPLGLLTVAAMLPDDWEVRLVDLNVEKLKDADLKWADYVMISAMLIQKISVFNILERCRSLGTRVIAGGPLFNSTPDE